MPNYKYIAQTKDGKKVKGVREAISENVLQEALSQENLFLIEAKNAANSRNFKKLSTKQLMDFCRQMGTLLSAGVSLVRAFRIIAQQDTIKESERAVYFELLDQIRTGTALSDAMISLNGVFPDLLTSMISTGEAGGNMDKVMTRMAEHYEKSYKMSKKVSGAATYPIILLTMLVGVVIFLITYIIPQFDKIFEMIEELPGVTKFLIAFSTLLTDKWLLAVMVLAGIIVVTSFLFSIPSVRFYRDKMRVKWPYFGKLMRTIYTARFARTINSLYGAGLALVSALNIGSRTLGNTYLQSQFKEVIAKVRSGESLSAAVAKVDGFVSKLADSIMVGEETGSLDMMLATTADTLEYESDAALDKMVAALEPALIVFMALAVGTVMLGVMVPVFQYYQSVQNMV
ncbi:MAG: type II secretion system F family protein [Eubacteriaceae bacterium]|nr:type II secretion system F family protein [Eubacteriaceae bacterium]